MANATPLVLLVTDTCNDCAATQLNIHSLAFQINFNSNLAVGQVNVQWQQVKFPAAWLSFCSSTRGGMPP